MHIFERKELNFFSEFVSEFLWIISKIFGHLRISKNIYFLLFIIRNFTYMICVYLFVFTVIWFYIHTGIGCGLSMLGFGLYLLYKSHLEKLDTPQYQWFPILCLFTFTICCTCGYLIVPWVMIGELYPLKVRGFVGGMTTFAAHSFVFIVVKTYPTLLKSLDDYGTFLLYASFSFIGSFFSYIHFKY